jgi:hypothetical protein
MGTVVAILYARGGAPPDMPIGVVVNFPHECASSRRLLLLLPARRARPFPAARHPCLEYRRPRMPADRSLVLIGTV